MKRKASEKRSGKRGSSAARAASGARATRRPKRGATRPAAKPKVNQRASQTQTTRTQVTLDATAGGSGCEPSGAALDPRIAAAVALALHDEALAAARAEELARPVSGWTALARARGVQRR